MWLVFPSLILSLLLTFLHVLLLTAIIGAWALCSHLTVTKHSHLPSVKKAHLPDDVEIIHSHHVLSSNQRRLWMCTEYLSGFFSLGKEYCDSYNEVYSEAVGQMLGFIAKGLIESN